MLLTHKEIEQELANLGRIVPRLLQDNQGAEFWIEFLDRANTIKDRSPMSLRDGVTERIYDLLAKYGVSPPWRWITGRQEEPAGRVYAFPSGVRVA
ncbi:hypothetical protein [Dyella mobilis]|uniref:Uncharacterized protein n=1 Tax=Dyella mobilis TaxID=1849582 RepID=A0ABS2KMI8_9GAMM|nr:hypothetical protein [Dyella mobilis]MBM7132260.1 hypothetical protein [Dyella mobilis]GLQ95754.1 hypothetical protein GCM10007863_01720 [Dyella mobilis]